jgi:hypothetical protein
MVLRFESGDRAGALAEFESFERRLAQEIGAQPMPETRAVYESLRRGKTPQGAWIDNASDDRPGRRVMPFVGRADELAKLRYALGRAARGQVCFALVSGEAGIGKTRLLQELVAAAQGQGARIAAGFTSPDESEPFQAIASALRGALPYLRVAELGVGAAALAALVPEVREFAPGLGQPADLEPELARVRLFDAVRHAFVQLCEDRPALIVFEDLHWAGASSLEEIATLCRALEGSALVVMTVREEDPGTAAVLRLFERVAPRGALHLALRPLSAEDVSEVLSRAQGGAPSSARVAELHTRSDGNPLFLSHLIGAEEGAIPASVADLVTARVQALSERARALLENAAVLGAGFELEPLRRTSAWTLADVFDGLDELLDATLVREQVGRRDEFAFTHHLVHEAAYDAIPARSRRRLHKRAGRALEGALGDRAGERAAAIARHIDIGGEADAVRWYETAARRALDVFANDDAIALATRGLALALTATQRFALLQVRESAFGRFGRRAEQADDCRSMAALARDERNTAWDREAARREADLAAHMSDAKAELQAGRRLEALAAGGDAGMRVEAATVCARASINGGNAAGARELLAAIAEAVDACDARLAVDYWWTRVFAETALHHVPAARQSLERMRAVAGSTDPRVARAAVLVAMQSFDADGLAQAAGDALAAYERTGDIEGMAFANHYLALAAAERFDLETQRHRATEALRLYERIGKDGGVYSVIGNCAVFARKIGLLDEAERGMMRALDLAVRRGRPHWIANSTLNLAFVAQARCDYARSQGLAQRARADALDLDYAVQAALALEAIGVAERELGDPAASLVHLRAAAAELREVGSEMIVGPLCESIETLLVLGDIETASAYADDVRDLLRASPAALTYPVAGYVRVAEAYRRAGREPEAAAAEAEALSLLRAQAEKIADPKVRAAYLGLPAHAGLAARLPAVDGAGTLAR